AVLVADGVAELETSLELLEQRLAGRRRALRHRLERPARDVGVPFLPGLPREQCSGSRTDVQRQRAAEAQRDRLNPQPVEPFDADGLVAAPDAEKPGLARPFMDSPPHGPR